MYNYNQERSSAKVQNQANPQQSKEKPNLFKRPEKQTEDYSLGEPNLDEPGNDFFYQKESFDNFYDTIKNDISPQKINDFNKLVVDFNGYINKLSIENARLKNKLIKAQEKIRSNEKKLIYHDKTRKRIEVNIQKKLEFEKELIKAKEQLEKENEVLKKQLNDAKLGYIKLKQSMDKKLKETLKRNFMEWQNHEKQNILKLKNCMEKEINERVALEKQDAEERFKLQIENIRTNLIRKEQKMKTFFEDRFRQEIKVVEKKLSEQFEYEKQLMKRDLINQLNDYKKELEIKAARDKRNERQMLIENYEDTVMFKERLIKQFQKEQNDLLRKIKTMKHEFESNNYQTLTTVNSFSEEQTQFMNDIAQKLTYSKMNLGFTSNDTLLTNNPIYQEPSLGDEFYSWINDSTLQNSNSGTIGNNTKGGSKDCSSLESSKPNNKKLGASKNNMNNMTDLASLGDKENLGPENSIEDDLSNVFGKDSSDAAATKLSSHSGTGRHHIKIEELQELSLGPLKEIKDGKSDDHCQTERYILRAPKDFRNFRFSKQEGNDDSEPIFQNKDDMSTLKSKEDTSRDFVLDQDIDSFIKLMKKTATTDECNTVTKDTDMEKSAVKVLQEWSDCWINQPSNQTPEEHQESQEKTGKLLMGSTVTLNQPLQKKESRAQLKQPSLKSSLKQSQASLRSSKRLDLTQMKPSEQEVVNQERLNKESRPLKCSSKANLNKVSESSLSSLVDSVSIKAGIQSSLPSITGGFNYQDQELSPSKLFEKRIEEEEKSFDQHMRSLENKYHSLIKERNQEIYNISKRHQKSEGICLEEDEATGFVPEGNLDLLKKPQVGTTDSQLNNANDCNSKETGVSEVNLGHGSIEDSAKQCGGLVRAIKMDFNDCDLMAERK